MRRFVKDERAILVFERFEGFTAAPRRCGGQKSAERECVRAEARSGQRCQRGRRSRNGNHHDAGGDGGGHQAIAGIGDQRGAGIGDQRTARARLQVLHQFRRACGLVVLVIAHQFGCDALK